MTAARVQPATALAVNDVEDTEIANRVRDGLHRDQNPVLVRLIPVLFTQHRTNFCRTKLQSTSAGGRINLAGRRTLRKPQLLDTRDDELEGLQLRGELGLAEDIARPIRDPATGGFESLRHRLGVLVPADLHRPPDRPVLDQDLRGLEVTFEHPLEQSDHLHRDLTGKETTLQLETSLVELRDLVVGRGHIFSFRIFPTH